MPLLDHFHPPLSTQRHWESFFAAWAGALADALNERWLPDGYFAEEQVHPSARVEIDVATFEAASQLPGSRPEAGVATAPSRLWVPPAPALSIPAVFPETFEVAVFRTEGGPTLVAAIELISPSNKDRQGHRRGFATKCASYLYQGISLVIVDVVTSRQGDLHAEVMQMLTAESAERAEQSLYSAAYRPARRGDQEQVDVWLSPLAVGNVLPVMPLCLGSDQFVPLDLEAAYSDACARRKIS